MYVCRPQKMAASPVQGAGTKGLIMLGSFPGFLPRLQWYLSTHNHPVPQFPHILKRQKVSSREVFPFCNKSNLGTPQKPKSSYMQHRSLGSKPLKSQKQHGKSTQHLFGRKALHVTVVGKKTQKSYLWSKSTTHETTRSITQIKCALGLRPLP